VERKVNLGEKKWPKREPFNRLIAVIDVGSNSVRMVVFKGLRRNPKIIFNERVLCGLGKQVSTHGKMEKSAMNSALSTLKRFSILCNDMKVDVVEAFATAAVRNASNGENFIASVKENCGIIVRTISGSDEARYSALGVISGFPKATGVVGDLGGGSLELINIENDEILDRVTLPIGPISLLGRDKQINGDQVKLIKDQLASVPWLNDGAGQSFYMVGGAWRSVTRLYLNSSNYPLKVLQGYTVPAEKMKKFCSKISKQAPEELDPLAQISKRRMPLLPTAALVLNAVLKQTNSVEVISSDNGIREGILYKMLNHNLRKQDPFLAACKDIADQTGRFPEHASKLMSWIDPIFQNENPDDNRLRYACCMLSDIGWEGHPDYRAERVFDEVFYGRFTGINHNERSIVALALYFIYGGPKKGKIIKSACKILSEQEQISAQAIGNAIRVGQRLTGGTSNPLAYTILEVNDDELNLIIPEQHLELAGKVVMSRLKDLGSVIKKKVAIVSK
jgi:exopolyphosphatase/guanosine-5'-triphosphate,3'-diphosphate pyrophosphatase